MLKKTHVSRNKTLPEIFEIVAKERKAEDKVRLLKLYDNVVLRWYIEGLFNRDWSDMPIPDFKKSHRPSGNNYITIKTAISRIEQAYKHRHNKPDVTERNLTIVLSEMSSDEAELLLKMFSHNRRITGIGKPTLKKAFPQFFLDKGQAE